MDKLFKKCQISYFRSKFGFSRKIRNSRARNVAPCLYGPETFQMNEGICIPQVVGRSYVDVLAGSVEYLSTTKLRASQCVPGMRMFRKHVLCLFVPCSCYNFSNSWHGHGLRDLVLDPCLKME